MPRARLGSLHRHFLDDPFAESQPAPECLGRAETRRRDVDEPFDRSAREIHGSHVSPTHDGSELVARDSYHQVASHDAIAAGVVGSVIIRRRPSTIYKVGTGAVLVLLAILAAIAVRAVRHVCDGGRCGRRRSRDTVRSDTVMPSLHNSP